MQISARNVFHGQVEKVANGVVNAEVTIELPGGLKVVSIITKPSTEMLEREEGKS
jgi:molybdate transport system regulatory protein